MAWKHRCPPAHDEGISILNLTPKSRTDLSFLNPVVRLLSLLSISQAFKTSYLMGVYLELFQEYQSTTLNTRCGQCDLDHAFRLFNA